MANKREEQPPSPGYAATLMGDDAKMVMAPLQIASTSLSIGMLQNLALSVGPALESPLFTPKALEATSQTPVLTAALRNNVAGPSTSPLLNPFAGGPKRGGFGG